MKKYLYPTYLAVLVFLVAYSFYAKHKANARLAPAISKTAKGQQELVQIAKNKIAQNIPTEKLMTEASEKCHANWRFAVEVSLETFTEAYKSGQFQLLKECEKFDLGIMSSMGKKSLAICQSHPLDLTNCSIALTDYRAGLIHAASKDDHDYESMDLGILMNKILHEIYNIDVDHVNPEFKKMAESLLKRNPQDEASYKATFIAHLDDIFSENPAVANRFKDLTSQARDLFPEDRQIYELYLTQHRDDPTLLDQLKTYGAEHPESALNDYYLAATEWRNGNREATLAYLSSAASKDPKDQRIKDSLAQAKTAKPGDHIFSIQIGFSFSGL